MRQTTFQQGSPDDYMALTDEVLMLREKLVRASDFQARPSLSYTLCWCAIQGIDLAHHAIFTLEKLKTEKKGAA